MATLPEMESDMYYLLTSHTLSYLYLVEYFEYFVFSLHRIFNTNNLWISLAAMKRVTLDGTLHMEIILNPKVRVTFLMLLVTLM